MPIDKHLVSKVEQASGSMTMGNSHALGLALSGYYHAVDAIDNWDDPDNWSASYDKKMGRTLEQITAWRDRYVRQFIALVYGKNPDWKKVK